MDILQTAVEAAKREGISTIVVASTTGSTAYKFLELVKKEKFQTIIVTHDEGRALAERRFGDNVRQQLLANNIKIYTHNHSWFLLRKIIAKILARFGFSSWPKHLKVIEAKYGTGIKVCHIIAQMLIEGGVLRDGKVVAIAGTKSGADSAGIFVIRPDNKWPILESVIGNT